LVKVQLLDATGNERTLSQVPQTDEAIISIFGMKTPWPSEPVYRLETWWQPRWNSSAAMQTGMRQLSFTVQPDRWSNSVPPRGGLDRLVR
jgi:hypothetical protein